MPTVVRASSQVQIAQAAPKAEQTSDNAQLVPIALFSAIGLLVSLVAMICGVQGAWY